jgi:hypothetical protein
VVCQKFISSVQTMGTNAYSNPPVSPFFKGGELSQWDLTPLWKRGEGEIFGGVRWGIFCKLLGQDTATIR